MAESFVTPPRASKFKSTQHDDVQYEEASDDDEDDDEYVEGNQSDEEDHDEG